MKKIKLIFLTIIITVMCTGCTIEYNITINEDNIEEIINVNDYVTSTRTSEDILKHYKMWYPVFVNYINDGETIELEDFSEKADGIEYYQKNIKEKNNGYQYTYKYMYDIDDYYDSYALATTFVEPKIHKSNDTLVLKTSKENLLCNYDYFDSLKINITIDPKVYELNYTNTSNINGNTYTWELDKNNCYNSQIILTLNTKETENDTVKEPNNNYIPKEKNKKDYTLYIFLIVLIILILIGYFIYNKIKLKNSNFDIDD